MHIAVNVYLLTVFSVGGNNVSHLTISCVPINCQRLDRCIAVMNFVKKLHRLKQCDWQVNQRNFGTCINRKAMYNYIQLSASNAQ